MELNKSILCVHSKAKDIFYAAYDHKVIFGTAENSQFEKASFTILNSEICDLFCGLFGIVKALSNNQGGAEDVLLKKSENISYMWLITKRNNQNEIHFQYIDSKELIGEITFDVNQFNDCLFLIGNLFLPSLNLDEKTFEIVNFMLTMDLDQILKFRNQQNLTKFLEFHKKNFQFNAFEHYRMSFTMFYHLDVIVAIHNIKSLYNSDISIMVKNIDNMLSCSC